MASAQVLPSSRKQEHLAAGKRRLEEFRKKKAADRAKKTNEKQPSDIQITQAVDSNGVAHPAPHEAINQSFAAESNGIPYESKQKGGKGSFVTSYSDYPSNDSDMSSQPSAHTSASDQDYKRFEVSGSNGPLDYSYNQENKEKGDSESYSYSYNQENKEIKGDSGITRGSYGDIGYGVTSDRPTSLPSQLLDASDISSGQSTSHGMEESQEKESQSNLKEFSLTSSGGLQPVTLTPFASERGNTGRLGDSNKSDFEERKFIDASNGSSAVQNVATYRAEYSSTAFSSDFSNSSNHGALYTPASEALPRRSRPSFLDSLNVPRASPSGPLREAIMANGPKLSSMDPVGPSTIGTQYTNNFSIFASTNNGETLPDASDRGTERKPDFYLPKQDEDFSALEQHIEDLTQEKFSLQRALEASRALAESLATENSSLTDSYNHQRSAVNMLKADMEKLQEEISAQLAELEAIRHQYTNAQLECNAADERAKLLASEVISLEEKALRLRSSELKLERQLENSHTEIASYKKKVGSLEKERLDLHSTISALQEEKKVLQVKLRKASTGKSTDLSRGSAIKKDSSTSTEDLDGSIDTSEQQLQESRSLLRNDASSSTSALDNAPFSVEASLMQIPPDQIKTIDNINIIISELALEKEELMKTLTSETSENSRLKDLNKELSRRLEAQTQRLELLTAQSMVSASMPAKLPETNTLYNTNMVYEDAAYADEGDEVVERVLGWIMKLFPGGPSRRRTSKHL